MPQLDTVYILTVYLWTWLMLHLITQKIKVLLMTSPPHKCLTPNKPTPTPQWL